MTSGGPAAAAAAVATASHQQQLQQNSSSDYQGTSSMASTSSSSSAAFPTISNVDIPPQLAQLSEGWLELESDPGLFSLLISDFGVRGVQVEEIYDLERPFTEQQPVIYGFIFLFNVIEERRNRSRRQAAAENLLLSSGGGNGFGGLNSGSQHLENPSPSSLLTGDYIFEGDGNEANQELLKQIFFAYQKVPNSCATHAILSVLLNCNVDLGPILRRLKEYTRDMSPESKGYAISNIPELAVAHNSHAAPQSAHREQQAKGAASNAVRISQRHSSSCEAFHYVSFLPIGGRLIELDGLKEAPIDHGPVDEDGKDGEPWTEKFRRLMRRRIEVTSGGHGPGSQEAHDIRYNLMAVIPSRYERAAASLRAMSAARLALLKMIQILEFSSAASGDVRRDHCYAKCGLLLQNSSLGSPPPLPFPNTSSTSTSKNSGDGGPQPMSSSSLKRKYNGELPGSSSLKRKNFGPEWPDPLTLARSPGTIRMTLDDDKLISAKLANEEGFNGCGNFTFSYDFPRRLKQDPDLKEEDVTEDEKKIEKTVENLPPAPSTSSSERLFKSTSEIKKERKDDDDKEIDDDDDDRTETASNASSSFDDHFDENVDVDEGVSAENSTVFESRFFVCKFEHRPKAALKEEKNNEKKEEKVTDEDPNQLPPLEVPTENNKENEEKGVQKESGNETSDSKMDVEEPASKVNKSKSTTAADLPSSTSSSYTPTITNSSSEEEVNTPTQIYSVLERIRALLLSNSSTSTSPSVADFESHLKAPILKDLLTLLNGLNRQIFAARRRFAEEEAKQRRYRLEDSRRVHDYDPFINAFLSMFFEAGLLDGVLEGELYQTPGGEKGGGSGVSNGGSSGEPSERGGVASSSFSASRGERSSVRAAEKGQQQGLVNGTKSVQIPNGAELGPLAPIVNSFSPAELTTASIALRKDYENALFFPANFSISAAMASQAAGAANTAENNQQKSSAKPRSRKNRNSAKLAVEEDGEDEVDDYEVAEDEEEDADDKEWNPADENPSNSHQKHPSSSRSRQSK